MWIWALEHPFLFGAIAILGILGAVEVFESISRYTAAVLISRKADEIVIVKEDGDN